MIFFKRWLAGCLSALVLVPGLTVGLTATAEEDIVLPEAKDTYYLVGRFQQEGNIASGSRPADGQVAVNIDAVTLVDISDYDPADLAVQVDLRATRHDGETGLNSLQFLRNGALTLKDSAGTELIKTGSPVQNGVPAAERVAGEWMTATFSLAGMAASSGKLSSLALFDYNDFPKQNPPIPTGITLEAKNARIVDTSRYADGMSRVNYEATAFYQAEGLRTSDNTTIRADWSRSNNVLDASANRGGYALMLDMEILSDDPTIDPATNWNRITVKLRSSDVTDKPDDPELKVNGGSRDTNNEHNYGWDFQRDQSYSSMDVDGAHVRLSIPLDTASTNARGLMDWADVQRLLCDVAITQEAKSHLSVNLSYARIVDLNAVADMKEQLMEVIGTALDETQFGADDLAAYQTIKATAQNIYDAANADPAKIRNAIAALKDASPATAEQKTELENWIGRETNWDVITTESRTAYQVAAEAGHELLASGATRAEAEEAIQAAKEAWFALEFNDSMPDYGNVDSSEDGITANDALLALQAATGKIALNEQQTVLANVDGKALVEANDALLILQYATKKISKFSVGSEDLSGAITAVENDDPLTACNPIDISYMFQRAHNEASLEENMATYRESADPAVVFFKDKYYLFASHGDGYWSSTDLADWSFIRVDVPTAEEDPDLKQLNSQFRLYAPATCVVGDTLYLTHSQAGDILKTTDPDDPTKWELVGHPFNWSDPSMYYDDPADGGTGYVYVYMGLSSTDPIRVVALDPANNMNLVDGPYECVWPDTANRGYAVSGDTNSNYDKYGIQEGAWMVKHDGKYYLTCATNGTEYAAYADDCFVSDSPTGPFVHCEYSPVIWKATGFVQGAGHGCLFQDEQGRWWKVDTCRIDGFERRLGIYPAIFDEDGELHANTVRSDYPFYIPTESENPFNEIGPGWDLISYGKSATASSNASSTSLAFNENMTNSWMAATGNAGEWLQVDLGRVYGVWSVQVNFADEQITGMGGRDNGYAYRYLMEFSQDGETWYTMVDRTQQTEDLSHEYIEFKEKIGARYVRITNKGDIPAGGNFAISSLRIFGEGSGNLPEPVNFDSIIYERRADNNRSIGIAWDAVPSAQGYIIRYGTDPDKLYTHYQVIGASSYVINSLIRGVDYYFTIDSYNESGTTFGTEIFKAPATEERQPYFQINSSEWDPSPAETNKATGFTVHEAEDATYGGDDVIERYEVRASGVAALHGMGTNGTYTEFSGVDGGVAGGMATLRISYASLPGATARIILNGQTAGTITLPKTGGWPSFGTADLLVTGMKAGTTNTIRIEGVGTPFILDWMQAIYTQASSYEPGEVIGGLIDLTPLTDYVLYEAENGVFGNEGQETQSVKAANDSTASGGRSLHDFQTAGSYVEFQNVDGGAGGAGILRFAYGTVNDFAEPTIYVNGKQLTDRYYSLPGTGSWTVFKTIQIAVDDLNPGATNTIRIEGGLKGFNPDYIQLIPDNKGDNYTLLF